MKIIDAWVIEVWDGGERHYPKFNVLSEDIAIAWTKDNPNDYFTKKQFIFYETLEEFSEEHKKKVREAALAKLSPEEKAILGLEG